MLFSISLLLISICDLLFSILLLLVSICDLLPSISLLLISICDCCSAFRFCSLASAIAVQHFPFARQHLRFAA